MKIAFVSPYFNRAHAGGGEKHLLEIALVAAQKHQVYICINARPGDLNFAPHNSWNEKKYQQYYAQFLGKDLSDLHFIFSPLCTSANFLEKLWFTTRFNAVFYATDGSVFISLAGKNYLHIQLPFNQPPNIWTKFKLKFWHHINTNSNFTKQVIEKHWPVKVDQVLYPMVNQSEFVTAKHETKQKTIISVGRFFRQLHSKRQDVLLTIFRKMLTQQPKLLKNWKLILVGGVEDTLYVNQLKKKAKGLPVEFVLDCSRRRLRQLLVQASIFWHSAGYEVDETVSPMRVEHFGIATIEAMAAGAIPIVLGKGGQVEIMSGSLSQLLWQTPQECIDKTVAIIKDPWLEKSMRLEALNRTHNFNQASFQTAVWQMLAS